MKENVNGVDGFVFLVGGDASLNKGDRKKSFTGRCVKNRSERIRQSMVSDLVRYRRSRTEEIL